MTRNRALAFSLLATAAMLVGCVAHAPAERSSVAGVGSRSAERPTPPASGINAIAMVDGRVLNSMPLFGRRDWVSLGCTLLSAPVRPRDAAGGESSDSTIAGGTADQVVYGFRFPSDTQLRVRFRSEATGSINGTIRLAPVQTGDGSLRAFPQAVDLVVRMKGQTISLVLDRSSPFNSLEASSDGTGFLSLAMTIDSKSDDLAWSLYLGETYFFRLPVSVDPEFRSLHFRLEPSIPAHLYTPTSEAALEAADGPAPIPTEGRS